MYFEEILENTLLKMKPHTHRHVGMFLIKKEIGIQVLNLEFACLTTTDSLTLFKCISKAFRCYEVTLLKINTCMALPIDFFMFRIHFT